MKYFLTLMLFFISSITPHIASAQEAKLVKMGEWGSGTYQQIIEIDGLYYIKTASNQLDVINPELTGKDALLGQINFNFDSYPYIDSISTFKNLLVVISNNNLSIYNIFDQINITRLYSITIGTNGSSGKNLIATEGDYLYVVDDNSKIYTIKYDGEGFNLENVIQAQQSDYDNNMYISNRSIFIENSNLYYLYNIYRDGEVSVAIEQYALSDYTLTNSGEIEDIGYISDSIYIGNHRLVISEYGHLYLLELTDSEALIVSDFNLSNYYSSFEITYADEVLYALSYSRSLKTFQISEDNTVTPLISEGLSNQYFSYSDSIRDFTLINGRLVGSSFEKGLFELVLEDNAIKGVDFFYNQSGYLGQAVINNHYLYLPRRSRIDVVDFADFDNMSRVGTVDEKAVSLSRFGENFIFDNGQGLGNYSQTSDFTFQLNSQTNGINNNQDIINQEPFVFSINYNQGYKVNRYQLDNEFGFYDSFDVIDFPELSNSCPISLSFIQNELIAFDPCGENKIHIFSQSLSENFEYDKTIESNNSYWKVITLKDYIYFIDQNEINISQLNSAKEFQHVSTVNNLLTGMNDITAVETFDDYLLISTREYFFLIDVSDAVMPKLISRTRVNNWELTYGSNIQFEGGYVLVTTEDQGQVKIFQINKAPVTETTAFSLLEDEELLSYFTDPESDSMTLSISKEAVLGDVIIDSASFIYKPYEHINGEDSFILKAEDIHGNFIEQEITVSIVPVNDAPLIETSELTLEEDIQLIEQLIVSDIEGDELTYSIEKSPEFGTTNLSDSGELTYVPNANYFGSDSIIVSVTDIHGATTSKELSVTIESVNDIPEIVDESFEGTEDTIVQGQLTAIDIEQHAMHFSVLENSSVNGQVSIESDGSFAFTPDVNFFGQASFIAQVTDSEQGVSQQEIIVSIVPVNDAPIIETSELTLEEDIQLIEQLIVSDIEGDKLTYSIEKLPEFGTANLSDSGELTFVPNTNYFGGDKITVSVTDIHGATTNKEISVTIESVNDIPEIVVESFEGTEDTVVQGKLTAMDVEQHAMHFSALENSSVNGQVSMQSDGSFAFTPDTDFFGQASFIAQVTDSEQGVSQQEITVNIEGVNDVPVVEVINTSVSHNGSISSTLPTTDVDGENLEYTIITDVSNGTLSMSVNGEYTYNPNTGFSGSDSFTYEVSDGVSSVQSTITFTIAAAPKPPISSKNNETSGGGSMGYLLLVLCLRVIFRKRELGRVLKATNLNCSWNNI